MQSLCDTLARGKFIVYNGGDILWRMRRPNATHMICRVMRRAAVTIAHSGLPGTQSGWAPAFVPMLPQLLWHMSGYCKIVCALADERYC